MAATMRRMRADGAKYARSAPPSASPSGMPRPRLPDPRPQWSAAVPTRPPGPGKIRGRQPPGGCAAWPSWAIRPIASPSCWGSSLYQGPRFPRPSRARRPGAPRPAPRRGGEWGYRDSAGPAAAAGLAEPPAAAAIAAELGDAEVPAHHQAGAEAPPATAPRRSVDPAEWQSKRAWGARDPSPRFGAAAASEAGRLRAAGATIAGTAQALGCSVGTVKRLLRGEAHGQGMRPDSRPGLGGSSPPRRRRDGAGDRRGHGRPPRHDGPGPRRGRRRPSWRRRRRNRALTAPAPLPPSIGPRGDFGIARRAAVYDATLTRRRGAEAPALPRSRKGPLGAPAAYPRYNRTGQAASSASSFTLSPRLADHYSHLNRMREPYRNRRPSSALPGGYWPRRPTGPCHADSRRR